MSFCLHQALPDGYTPGFNYLNWIASTGTCNAHPQRCAVTYPATGVVTPAQGTPSCLRQDDCGAKCIDLLMKG